MTTRSSAMSWPISRACPAEAFFRATASVGHSRARRGRWGRAGHRGPAADRPSAAPIAVRPRPRRSSRPPSIAIAPRATRTPACSRSCAREIAMLEGELADGEAALARLEADRAQWVEAHERREELDVRADPSAGRPGRGPAGRRPWLERVTPPQERYDRLKRAAELTESRASAAARAAHHAAAAAAAQRRVTRPAAWSSSSPSWRPRSAPRPRPPRREGPDGGAAAADALAGRWPALLRGRWAGWPCSCFGGAGFIG